MTLARALQEHRTSLGSPEHSSESVEKVIRQCVVLAMPHWQWEVATTGPGRGGVVALAKGSRLPELLDFCFSIGDFELCTLLASTASKTGTYESRMTFAKTLHDRLKDLPQTEDTAAKKEEFEKAIGTCVSSAVSKWELSVYDVQTQRVRELVSFCFTINQPNLCITFLNAVQQIAPYEVLVELAKTLHTRISTTQNATNGSTAEHLQANLHKVVRRSIEAAALKWEANVPLPKAVAAYGYWGAPIPQVPTTGPNARTNRICELVDLCFALGDLSPCVTLFNAVLRLPQQTTYEKRFIELYTPLIPQLKSTLLKHGKALTLEPFASFFRCIIALYLGNILAPNTPTSIPTSLPTRSAGCNVCSQCRDLNAFLKNSNKEIRFSAVQAIRTHLEKEIAKARIGDIVTIETIKHRSPYTLLVTKRPEIMARLNWKKSQTDAAAFVRSVAEDSELKRIMPERYNDVLRAVQGTRTFALTGTLSIPATVITSSISDPYSARTGTASGAEPMTTAEPPEASSSTSATGSALASSSTTIAGVKRKHSGQPPPNTIAVIDLT
ncbi:hypothetical protein NMY22_g18627 [Coprinellus aureogranulatus]|nr:hypothetical protein NMY22_g18627 [Coprinellus aureogranulatus]